MLFISKDLELQYVQRCQIQTLDCCWRTNLIIWLNSVYVFSQNTNYFHYKFCARITFLSFFFLLNQDYGERFEPGTSCFTSLTLYQQATCIISYLYYFFNFNSTLTNNFSVFFIPPCFVFPHSFHLVLFLSFLLLLFPPLSVFFIISYLPSI